MAYAIKVKQNSVDKYLVVDPYNRPRNYVESIESASQTTDMVLLSEWEAYAENDKAQGSVQTVSTVEITLGDKNVNLKTEMSGAVAAQGLAKLTEAEKEALGL